MSLKIEIQKFLNTLNNEVNYCVARGLGTTIYEPGSDLDLIINRHDKHLFDIILTKYHNWQVVNKIERYYVVSYFLYSKKTKIFFQIDCEFNFDWWSFEILNTSTILARRKMCDITKIYFANDIHANTMKLYRTLFWGQRLKEKYRLDLERAVELERIIIEKPLLSKSELKALLSNTNAECVASIASVLRRSIITHNFKKFGFLKVITRVFAFLFSEIRILFKNNGIELEITNPNDSNGLINYLQYKTNKFKSPFKNVMISSKSISLLKKLKQKRDATLTVHLRTAKGAIRCTTFEDGSVKLIDSKSNESHTFPNYDALWYYIAFIFKN